MAKFTVRTKNEYTLDYVTDLTKEETFVPYNCH